METASHFLIENSPNSKFFLSSKEREFISSLFGSGPVKCTYGTDTNRSQV